MKCNSHSTPCVESIRWVNRQAGGRERESKWQRWARCKRIQCINVAVKILFGGDKASGWGCDYQEAWSYCLGCRCEALWRWLSHMRLNLSSSPSSCVVVSVAAGNRVDRNGCSLLTGAMATRAVRTIDWEIYVAPSAAQLDKVSAKHQQTILMHLSCETHQIIGQVDERQVRKSFTYLHPLQLVTLCLRLSLSFSTFNLLSISRSHWTAANESLEIEAVKCADKSKRKKE